MIKKLKVVMKPEDWKLPVNELEMRCLKNLLLKVDELVDAVNDIQKEREAERFEIQEWIGILEAVRKSVNIHEKQIDELQMKLRPILEERESQIKVYEETMEMVKRNNPYAEQRKWIGKLCRFWDDNCKITKHLGILTRIDETAIVPYETENGFWYCACEPVKPTDSIIYKGGNNE